STLFPYTTLFRSRYCGLPAHQALEGTETDYLVPPEDEGGEEPFDAGAEEPAETTGADDGVAGGPRPLLPRGRGGGGGGGSVWGGGGGPPRRRRPPMTASRRWSTRTTR